MVKDPESPGKPQQRAQNTSDRDARLKAALRANLRRRKAAARDDTARPGESEQ